MFENWFKRHRNKTSLRLHAVGIPLAVLAIPALVVGIVRDSVPWCLVAAGLFVAGYALQYIGHRLEGNDVGEIILFKKLLGLPYIAEAPPRISPIKTNNTNERTTNFTKKDE